MPLIIDPDKFKDEKKRIYNRDVKFESKISLLSFILDFFTFECCK